MPLWDTATLSTKMDGQLPGSSTPSSHSASKPANCKLYQGNYAKQWTCLPAHLHRQSRVPHVYVLFSSNSASQLFSWAVANDFCGSFSCVVVGLDLSVIQSVLPCSGTV